MCLYSSIYPTVVLKVSGCLQQGSTVRIKERNVRERNKLIQVVHEQTWPVHSSQELKLAAKINNTAPSQ